MGVQLSISDLFTPATQAQWLAQILANAALLEMPVTSWQSGGVARTILAVDSNVMALEDALVSLIAQGGFLDFAATGTVTMTALNGQTVTVPVSPDPSTAANPTGALTWLDLIASSEFDVFRIGNSAASGLEYFANSSASTYGPYAVGTYHISNIVSGATYSNQSSLTIAPSSTLSVSNISAASPCVVTATAHGLSGSEIIALENIGGMVGVNGFWRITVIDANNFSLNGSSSGGTWLGTGSIMIASPAQFAADVAGPSGTSGPGGINQSVTSLAGVYVGNVDSFIGANYESNVSLAARCRLKMQSLSPDGPGGAYQYFALTASQILAQQTPPSSLTTPINRVLVQTSSTTGIINVIVANAVGEVPGVSNLAVTAATNATPIAISSASPHGLDSGAYVKISGVIGNTNANGTWVITKTGSSTFTLNGSIGNAAYVDGGTIEGGDLGLIDSVIQRYCVPDNITALTSSASNFDVAIAGTVVVPQAFVSTYQVNVQTALANYFASLGIGNVPDNIIELDIIIGILFSAGSVSALPSYVSSVSGVTLNGVAADLDYPAPSNVATLSPAPNITVLGS